MIRSLLIGIVCLGLSCGPADEQNPRTVYRAGAWDLACSVRDHGDKHYRGCRVQVRVPPGSYTTDGHDVRYFSGLPRTDPVIVFRCLDPQPAAGKESLVVMGTFVGAVTDGKRKADRIDFVIYISDCTCTRVE